MNAQRWMDVYKKKKKCIHTCVGTYVNGHGLWKGESEEKQQVTSGIDSNKQHETL